MFRWLIDFLHALGLTVGTYPPLSEDHPYQHENAKIWGRRFGLVFGLIFLIGFACLLVYYAMKIVSGN